MDDDFFEEYIKIERKKYNKTKYLISPALNNEKVYFNRDGFNHLIRKGKRLRLRYDQIKRISLIPYARIILKNTCIVDRYREEIKDNKIAKFWSLRGKINGIKIKVIVRQIGEKSHKHFFSVMEEL